MLRVELLMWVFLSFTFHLVQIILNGPSARINQFLYYITFNYSLWSEITACLKELKRISARRFSYVVCLMKSAQVFSPEGKSHQVRGFQAFK